MVLLSGRSGYWARLRGLNLYRMLLLLLIFLINLFQFLSECKLIILLFLFSGLWCLLPFLWLLSWICHLYSRLLQILLSPFILLINPSLRFGIYRFLVIGKSGLPLADALFNRLLKPLLVVLRSSFMVKKLKLIIFKSRLLCIIFLFRIETISFIIIVSRRRFVSGKFLFLGSSPRFVPVILKFLNTFEANVEI